MKSLTLKRIRLYLIFTVLAVLMISADGDLAGSILEKVLNLGGIGALLGVVFDLLKRFGVIKDGKAPVWNAVISFLIGIVMLVAPMFGFEIPWDLVDSGASIFSQIVVAILSLVGIFGSARIAHFTFKESPLGYSHSK